MRYLISMILLLVILSCASHRAIKTPPVKVILTAGQSNTDGRIMNTELPPYILNDYGKNETYKYCKISKGSRRDTITGLFSSFWPTIGDKNNSHKWAYDAITYYWLEKSLQKDFYVIKWSLGGTAIDTAAISNSKCYWQADANWLARNTSTINGGHSLLLSFEENINTCIDSTLSKLENGYEISAFLWHQGESDSKYGEHYYDNLKKVVAHVRTFLVKKTNETKYARLPFICGTVSRSNKGYSESVEKAMYRLAAEDKDFYVIDMSKGELQKDQLHFTKTAGEYFGTEIYNKLVDLGLAGVGAKKIRRN